MFSFLLRLAFVLILSGTASFATNVGDTYGQVIAEKGQPKSQMAAGARRLLTYADALIKLDGDLVISVRAVTVQAPRAAVAPATAAAAPPEQAALADNQRKLDAALARVREIVNQPVESVPLTPDMKYKTGVFKTGWFHPGAITPHFIDTDVRSTQDVNSYSPPEEFVTCNLTPGVAFRSADCEFNSMTKFFYIDRSLPKKRLTEDEMQEINALYHRIGVCAANLQLMGHPWTPAPGG